MAYLYEVRGSDVYPTVVNTYDDYGLPAFEIRGTYAYPTVYNNHDDYRLPAFEVRQAEYEDISLPGVVYAAAAGAGFFAAKKAYSNVRSWWQERAKRKANI